MPRAMIVNSYKNTKRAIDTISCQFAKFGFNNSSVTVVNNMLMLMTDLSVPDIGEKEAGVGTIFDCVSTNLDSAIGSSVINRFQLGLIKTQTPVNFVYTATVTGFYSATPYSTKSPSSSDDYEILFTGAVRSMGTLDTESDSITSSSFPINTINLKTSGYLNILTCGLIHIINRTTPTD